MSAAATLSVTVFTDPMMGLSYESEPFIRKLETHFAERIIFKYVMSGLVRNVYQLVEPSELKISKEHALRQYNSRLARIYESEEYISGMPISMQKLELFSPEHTSSIPLNLAYKAAQLADPSKADLFLYNLRYATIVKCRPTTHFEEISKVVGTTSIDPAEFDRHYWSGSAQAALGEDFSLRQKLGVRSLPAYLFQYLGRSLLVSGVMLYADFQAAIGDVSSGELTEKSPEVSVEAVRDLIDRHPLISPIEIKEAFGLSDIGAVKDLISPLLEKKFIQLEYVPRGWFVQKCQHNG